MATNFPGSLDSFTNPTGSDDLGDSVGGRTHSQMHADVNDAIEALQATLNQPRLYGLAVWSFDPVTTASSDGAPTLTTVYAQRVYLPAMTVTNLHLLCVAGGGTPTNAYMALYSDAGTLLSASGSVSMTVGLKTFALGSPQVIAAGFYQVAHWQSGGTAARVKRANSVVNAVINMGATPRAATSGTSATTSAPSPLGTLTGGNDMWWIGIS